MTPTSSRISPFDHGARLVLAAALMLIYAVISIGIRFLGRWPKDLREFYPEDAALIAAAVGLFNHYLFEVAQYTSLLIAFQFR
jgi:hypothetical protein